MIPNRTRLFVIIDPENDHQVALLKALLIAKLGMCHIHAFMCVYADLGDHGKSSSRRDLKYDTVKLAKARLEKYLQPCEQCNIPFTCEVVWNSHWYDAALKAIAKSGCDLVIKSSFHHARAKRFFHKTSDYSLMRNSPSPVFFTHQAQQWKSDKILACIDLESTDARHHRLNNVVIKNAKALSNMLVMDMAIAAVYEKNLFSSSASVSQREEEATVAEIAEIYDVKIDNVYLRQGDVVDTLGTICEEVTPDILVLGTIARSGMEGKLIGNTAEKLLDRVDADLLAVN